MLKSKIKFLFCSVLKQNGMRRSPIICLKDIDYCPIEIIKALTDKGQFQ